MEGKNIGPHKPHTIETRRNWINGKNPDFTCVNGKKLLIEHFGTYYYQGEDPEERKKIFSEFGYKTLVIWEKELENINEVESKIRNFIEKGGSYE